MATRARSIRFHPAARIEFSDALAYHEQQRIGYADEFEAEVEIALLRAHDFPLSGRLVYEIPGIIAVRSFLLDRFRYSLMVEVENGSIVVYAVAHQHRKPGYWLGRIKQLE